MKSFFILALALTSCLLMSSAVAADKAISLDDFVSEAIKKHPELESAHWREEFLDAQLETYRSTLLPSLEAGPLITRGAPGGTSVLGYNGNISANMRSGQGFAGVIRYTAWDFGRTSAALRAGGADVEFARAETQRIKGELMLNLARDYLECSRNKDVLEVLLPFEKQIQEISTTIANLVKSGQRTPVEDHLSRAQVLEVGTQIQIAKEKIQFTQKKLAAMIRQDTATCFDLEALSSNSHHFLDNLGSHLSLLSAHARVKAANERVDFTLAERYPRFQLLGNAGYFDSQNLSDPWNYSVSAALSIPIWDARIESDIRKSEAIQQQAKSDLRATELRIDTLLISAEEHYQVAETQARELEQERNEAIQGFQIAKKRYERSVGLLIELRETVRNLMRVSLAYSDAKAELMSTRFMLTWYRHEAQ